MTTKNRIEVEGLPEDACWDLLRRAEVGRLAVWVEDHPDIFPVNFTVDHGSIVFRTTEGTKVAAALSVGAVAMEIDGIDSEGSHAWSVVVKGRAQQITETAELMDTFALPLSPWQAGTKEIFIRILSVGVTGRRFPIASPKFWHHPLSDSPRAFDE